VKKRCRFL